MRAQSMAVGGVGSRMQHAVCATYSLPHVRYTADTDIDRRSGGEPRLQAGRDWADSLPGECHFICPSRGRVYGVFVFTHTLI